MDTNSFFTIIGIIAAVLTTSSLIPQIIKGIRRKDLTDVSGVMLIVQASGNFLWVIYATFKNDFVLLFCNIVTFSFVLITSFLKLKYKKSEIISN